MTTEEERSLRTEIAEAVEEKMAYINTCPNERDTILGIILGEPLKNEIHCSTDCWDKDCKCYNVN